MIKNSLTILLLSLLIFSCKEQSKTEKIRAKANTVVTLSNPDVNAEGTFLFKSVNEMLINWTETQQDKSKSILKFAFFNPETESFTKPITVTPSVGLQSHAESMAKVAITKDGMLYAFFRIKSKNSRSMYGGTLYFATSNDKGTHWSEKQKVVIDNKSTSQSFYDVTQLPDGELGLIWLDNRKIDTEFNGQNLYFTKTNKKSTLTKETLLETSVCQCCRTDIEVSNNNDIHIGFRNLIEPNEIGFPSFLKGTQTEVRDMYYITSKDNGITFTKATPISDDNWQVNGCPHTGPSLAYNGTTLGAVWFTGAHESGIYFNTKNKNDFSSKNVVSKEGKHPQMTAFNQQFYIVYETYYEQDSKGYSKIELQERNAEKLLKTTEISNPKTDNNHAVLKMLNNKQILISWVNTDLRNASIQYQVHNLN